jgi:translation initiation factor 2 subunit 1
VGALVKKRGMPSLGELVVCKIKKINPNSGFAKLEEYENLEGMIHISEVSSGWVRDIRSFIKPEQMVIAKVIRIDDMNRISLSLKRVDERQENEKLKEYKLNQRAEKMLQLAAARQKKTLEQAYEEIGYLILESMGSLYVGFKTALQAPEQLKKRGIPDMWIKIMKEIAEKSIEQKDFEFKAKLMVKSSAGDGIKKIRETLKSVELMGLEVHYITAPEYSIKFRTKNAKKGEKEFEEKLRNIEKLRSADIEIEVRGGYGK